MWRGRRGVLLLVYYCTGPGPLVTCGRMGRGGSNRYAHVPRASHDVPLLFSTPTLSRPRAVSAVSFLFFPNHPIEPFSSTGPASHQAFAQHMPVQALLQAPLCLGEDTTLPWCRTHGVSGIRGRLLVLHSLGHELTPSSGIPSSQRVAANAFGLLKPEGLLQTLCGKDNG